VALVAVLGLGAGTYVAVGYATDGSSSRQPESADLVRGVAPTASPGGGRPTLTPATSGAPTQADKSPEPGTPTSEPTPARSTEATREPATASPGSGTPLTSLSRPRATRPTPADLAPPNTSLSAEFPAPDAARFTFGATETASFTCRLDGGAWTPCGSPTQYVDLASGWHTFAVQATDAAGNVDPSPATTRWRASGGGPAKPGA
jgi:hypothetical protein